MKPNTLMLMFVSCGISFVAAAWMFTAGYGLMAAFCIYAFGGAALMMVTSVLICLPDALPPLATHLRLDMFGNPRGTTYRLVRFRNDR